MVITLEIAHGIILTHLGEKAASNYEKFFEGEDPKIIEESLEEILTKLMGSEKAKQEINALKK